jgi:hypothetical protein
MLLAATTDTQTVSLVRVLAEIAHFDDASLLALSNWASYENPQPPDTPITDLDQVEVEALKLQPADRDALFAWLEHQGRGKLYQAGMTDSQIGPCQPLFDRNSCKNAALSLSQASAAKDLSFRSSPQQQSGVAISSGFAAVSTNSTTLSHCVAFENTTMRTISAITFTYKLLGVGGDVLTAGSDVLVGSFGAGSQTAIPASASELQSQMQIGQALPPNCWTKKAASSDPAMQRAAVFSIGVASVTFEDGTHWP